MSCWKEPNSKHAFVLSWTSTILTTIFAITGIVYYNTSTSVMCLVFGLENLVDFLSSVVVLWRFWASGTMTKEREKILKRRELRASMAISIILMVLGMGVIGTSSYDLATGPGMGHDVNVVLVMAGVSIVVFGFLAVFKFRYANALGSESLYKDGVCSLIGTILAGALFTNTLLIRTRPQIWWVDPCVATICGFAALFLGFHSTFVAWKHRRVPIFSMSWWMMSRGDGKAHGRRPPPERGREQNDNGDDCGNVDDGVATAGPSKKQKAGAVEMKEGFTNISTEIV